MALAVSAERSEGLVSDPAGRAVRCGVCSAPRIPDPALQRKVAGFAPSGISELPRISDPALVAELPGALCAGDPGARNSASGGELRGLLCRGRVPVIFDPAPGSVAGFAAFWGPRGLWPRSLSKELGGSPPLGSPTPPRSRVALQFGRAVVGAGAGFSWGQNRARAAYSDNMSGSCFSGKVAVTDASVAWSLLCPRRTFRPAWTQAVHLSHFERCGICINILKCAISTQVT